MKNKLVEFFRGMRERSKRPARSMSAGNRFKMPAWLQFKRKRDEKATTVFSTAEPSSTGTRASDTGEFDANVTRVIRSAKARRKEWYYRVQRFGSFKTQQFICGGIFVVLGFLAGVVGQYGNQRQSYLEGRVDLLRLSKEQALSVATVLQTAIAGDESAFGQVESAMASLREYLAGLNAIDANGEALPTRESYAEALGGSGVLGTRKPVENLDAHLLQIGKAWSTFRSQSRVVALDKTIFVTAATAVERFNQATNELKETLTTDEDAPVLLVRLVESIREKTLSGPQDFKDAVDVANLYLTSLERAFPNGVPASIAQKNGAWITQLGRVLNARSERFNPVILANAIGADAKRLSNRLTVLEQETLALTPQGSIAIFLATVAGVLALAALAGVGVSVAAQQAVTADEDLRRSREEKEKSDALQREFIGLIEEMAVIADGNLTVQVNANRESDVSSLAFMINTMADQLRPALAAAGRVAKSMQESVGTAVAMASRSQQSQQRQIETAQQIARIATDIQESIRKVEEVATSTAEISADAERAVEVGSEAQQRVREGLDAVREGAFTNNKRARALAESVTGIVDSYQLIREVAQQTYVIALNTSLLGAQLTGEEGNHIRVLGDRVSDLARSIRDREPELRASLSRILNETAELSASLEQAEALVNKATDESRLSEAAIDNMLKLTKSVSELTQKNAAEVGAQRAQADVLLSSSQAVGSTAQEAATAVQQTVEQIKPLVGQAQEMDKQLSQFKVA